MTRRPRRSSAETRAEILGKAEDLFRSAGYAGTSIADIAAALGMSPANVFKHFASKLALAEAISAVHLGLIRDALAAVPEDLPPPVRLRRFAEVLLASHLTNMEGNPHVFDLVVHTMTTQPEPIRTFDADLRRILLSIVEAGVRSGDFSSVEDPSRTVEVLLDCLAGVTHPLLIQHLDHDTLFARLGRMNDFMISSLRA